MQDAKAEGAGTASDLHDGFHLELFGITWKHGSGLINLNFFTPDGL